MKIFFWIKTATVGRDESDKSYRDGKNSTGETHNTYELLL